MDDEYRIGTVHSVNENRKTARVKYDSLDDMISAELKVLWQGEAWLPNVNDTVLCLCPHGWDGDGFVIGRI